MNVPDTPNNSHEINQDIPPAFSFPRLNTNNDTHSHTTTEEWSMKSMRRKNFVGFIISFGVITASFILLFTEDCSSSCPSSVKETVSISMLNLVVGAYMGILSKNKEKK